MTCHYLWFCYLKTITCDCMILKLTSLYNKSPIKYVPPSYRDPRRSLFYIEARQRPLLLDILQKIMLHAIHYKNTFSTFTRRSEKVLKRKLSGADKEIITIHISFQTFFFAKRLKFRLVIQVIHSKFLRWLEKAIKKPNFHGKLMFNFLQQ